MKSVFKNSIVLALLLLFSSWGFAILPEGEISLKGNWKFNLGNNPEWANPNFDDTQWDDIYAPADWEGQGYRMYDGFAWYRKNIKVDNKYAERVSYLELGYIDDVDEVFFNGTKIGQTGKFPPFYSTGYNNFRKYLIPNHLINYEGENVISVRVYDSQLNGGIVKGDLKIKFEGLKLPLDINLEGEWYFNKGEKIDLEGRDQIIVPGLWENQGYYRYDGYGTYSCDFFVPDDLNINDLVFVVGRIDDADKVYINGKFVGSTGRYGEVVGADFHLEARNYFLAKDIVQHGKNTVQITVWDERWDGGIVEGPIGLITQEKFRKYWMSQRQN